VALKQLYNTCISQANFVFTLVKTLVKTKGLYRCTVFNIDIRSLWKAKVIYA